MVRDTTWRVAGVAGRIGERRLAKCKRKLGDPSIRDATSDKRLQVKA
jgi:hypothetical protein